LSKSELELYTVVNTIKLIKSRAEYFSALVAIECLLAASLEGDSRESELLDVYLLLIEDYERKNIFLTNVDPISAIEFRMAEQGLRQKDLVPIIGSRSRVSEVLSRERPLTLSMIRALSAALGIPLEILIKVSTKQDVSPPSNLDIDKFPLSEMIKRGWLGSLPKHASRDTVELAVNQFLTRASGTQPVSALYRSGLKLSGVSDSGMHSCFAWLARVSVVAKEVLDVPTYRASTLNAELLSTIAKLSSDRDGPVKAIELLRSIGVIVVVEPGLPKSHIDGAAFLANNRTPIIGLTLRYDRVDHFWFTLLHELGHVWLHLSENGSAYVDNFSNTDVTEKPEKEANRVARDAFIPISTWKRSPASISPTKESLISLASKHEIHPAILAGRFQFESGNFQRFRNLLGQGEIRKHFPKLRF